MNFMSYVAKVSREWDEPNARDMERMMSRPNVKATSRQEPAQAPKEASNLDQAMVNLSKVVGDFVELKIHQCSAQSKN
ncbi:hypothetical protein AAG906_019430 [Vitis piasezkii]